MIVLDEKKEDKVFLDESSQDRSVGHRAGVKLCEGFISQAYKSKQDVGVLKDLLSGLLDGCNEILIRHVEKNQFKNVNAHDVISRMSIALDDSFEEISKIRV